MMLSLSLFTCWKNCLVTLKSIIGFPGKRKQKTFEWSYYLLFPIFSILLIMSLRVTMLGNGWWLLEIIDGGYT